MRIASQLTVLNSTFKYCITDNYNDIKIILFTWKDLKNVQRSVRMPSPRLSSFTNLNTRNRRKKLILMIPWPGWNIYFIKINARVYSSFWNILYLLYYIRFYSTLKLFCVKLLTMFKKCVDWFNILTSETVIKFWDN